MGITFAATPAIAQVQPHFAPVPAAPYQPSPPPAAPVGASGGNPYQSTPAPSDVRAAAAGAPAQPQLPPAIPGMVEDIQLEKAVSNDAAKKLMDYDVEAALLSRQIAIAILRKDLEKAERPDPTPTPTPTPTPAPVMPFHSMFPENPPPAASTPSQTQTPATRPQEEKPAASSREFQIPDPVVADIFGSGDRLSARLLFYGGGEHIVGAGDEIPGGRIQSISGGCVLAVIRGKKKCLRISSTPALPESVLLGYGSVGGTAMSSPLGPPVPHEMLPSPALAP